VDGEVKKGWYFGGKFLNAALYQGFFGK